MIQPLYIYKNGSAFSTATFKLRFGSAGSIGMSDIISLAATDYLEFYINSTSGADIADGETGTYASIHKIA